MNGYEKFFKEASVASGLSSPKGETKKKSFKIKAQEPQSSTPEDRMRRHVRASVQKRRVESGRKKQGFPVFPAICVAVAALACAIGFFKPELADNIFGRVELSAFGQAQAADDKAVKPKAEKAAGDVAPAAAKAAATEGTTKDSAAPDVKGWSEEELSFFKKLNERKQELDLRETELNKLEEELQKQKLELDGKIKQLESMRSDISKTLKTRVANDQEKVDKLVQFYSNMKPAQAAKVIESINEDLAVEVLDKLKKKNAAEIMDMMDAKKAERLSELMTGYQRTPAADAESTKKDEE